MIPSIWNQAILWVVCGTQLELYWLGNNDLVCGWRWVAYVSLGHSSLWVPDSFQAHLSPLPLPPRVNFLWEDKHLFTLDMALIANQTVLPHRARWIRVFNWSHLQAFLWGITSRNMGDLGSCTAKNCSTFYQGGEGLCESFILCDECKGSPVVVLAGSHNCWTFKTTNLACLENMIHHSFTLSLFLWVGPYVMCWVSHLPILLDCNSWCSHTAV